ncbi:MAG: polyribonucleotide nucleotidyltransferase [Candidatus Liptonbacteria bacterium RIFCSPLOWO2_01_FULL_52_25]|uniref:Polyribonucleotide nucleotidyltransferase n=1 Tax=Candidatus Liptonbacteria bacterium RIFCSPLOWO2_01_FULL_52_25 TaxID=1798650 RepID=A0A1G2CE90_9BACT|nr:MAG: polyribonucleotide nucleotidyltransferase [Candidatus Liptonbacteria bacterium RIFCSPLOWO2_01_FULL_52_25]
MLQRKQFTTEIGGKTLTVELSILADQTNASVITKYGETVALTTVVMSRSESNLDYMPLKVDYEEKFYAAGKILGSRFVRRESRPSEDAILAGRTVDRVIRPLFDRRMRRDIQVVVTILQYDEENDPEFVGLIGASCALGISDVPWGGPVAGVRITQTKNGFKINPNDSEIAVEKPVFDAFLAGSHDRINMIELGGDDAKEKDVVYGFSLAQKEINKLIEFQKKIIAEVGKPKAEVVFAEPDPALKTAVLKFIEGKLEEAVFQPTKADHYSRIGKLKTELFLHVKETFEAPNFKAVDFLFEEAINDIVHKNALEQERRPDGRKLDEVRELNGEVALFPRAHGSAVFVRGNTQALGMTTLAPPGQEQLIESMETNTKRRFMLHYNFPAFSVGETGNFRGPGRREIGHGNLARKSVEALIPPKEEFPYTIRVVSEILASNGSSSMATVCASVMSLMDAGVPIKKPAAGIAMGLMLDKRQATSDKRQVYKILTDIQGPEDHHGDMDFKVAGTDDGVNAMQMDVKVDGVTLEMVERTMEQAKKARHEILKFMKTVIHEPRKELSKYVPTIRQLKINPEKIGTLIGPGGKMINGLIKRYALTSIDVEEDGNVFVSGNDLKAVETAVAEITSLTKEFKVGEIIEGKAIKILDFGAIIDLGGGRDGMLHVSELKNGYVKTVTEVVKLGDFVRAKVIRVDEDGRIGLSLKQL